MKSVLRSLLLLLPLTMTGCSEPASVDVSEGVELSEVEAYKKMVAESAANNAGSDETEAPRPK